MTEDREQRTVTLSRLRRLFNKCASRRATICLLSSVLCLQACGQEPLYQEQSYVFGTLVDITLYGESEPRARQAANDVLQEFQRLHNRLHAWKPSELSELNAAFAKGESMAVSTELAAMLQDATQLSQQSGGLFNPAIGGLVQLWGFHADEFKADLPEEKRVLQWVRANPQMGDIVLPETVTLPLPNGHGKDATPDNETRHARFPLSNFPPQAGERANESLREFHVNETARYLPKSSGGKDVFIRSVNKAVQLDLGGYAKGYALDRAAEILRKRGINNALVNIGGNVIALGQHGKRPWRIGIQHPRKPGALATLELHDGEAIGTSGDYQRYFMSGDKRYCHLIDPRNGHPVQGVQSVTILTRGARAGILSDAASKPLFIAGTKGWHTAAAQMNLPEAMLVDDTGNIHVTAAFQKRLEFTDKNIHVQVE
jgi:thiamine biosynthesis lipoprotein